MTKMYESTALPADQDVALVQGGVGYLHDIERRLAPYVTRAELRQRAMAYLRGLLSPAERKDSWQLVVGQFHVNSRSSMQLIDH